MKLKGCSKTLARNMLNKHYSSSYHNHPWCDERNPATGNIQAHHVIPHETVNTPFWKKIRKACRYDINEWENGVFLPSKTELACQLKVAVHRSNHNRGLNYESTQHFIQQGQAIPDDIDLTLHANGLTYLDEVREHLKNHEIS